MDSTKTAPTQKPPPARAAASLPILLLSAAGFTILTTEFIIVGLLPSMARDLHVTIPQAGLLVTLFAATVAAVGPALTARLIGYERKKVFVAALLLFALSNVLAATAPNIGVMAIARFIPALMLPVFWSLSSETAVQITGPERAGEAVATVGFGVVLATVFGIPIGTLISDRYGWRTAFAVITVLALAKALLLFLFLPRLPGKPERTSVLQQLGILREPRILGHIGLSLLVFAGIFTAYTYLADVLERLGGFNGSAVGWILMGFGGMGVLGNWLGGRLVDRRNAFGASILLCIPTAVCLLALTFAIKSAGALALVLAVWGICQPALFTVSHTRVMKAAVDTPALGASLNVSGANMGIALGALVGGRVIHFFGLAWLGLASAVILALAIGAAMYPLGQERRLCRKPLADAAPENPDAAGVA